MMGYLISGMIGFVVGLAAGIFLLCLCIVNGKDK